MEKKRPEIDIVNEVLEDCILAYPISSFIISLYKQYQQRGSLSKKQLQGLYAKAAKAGNLPAGKLATLEAVINKMATRYKSELPPITPLYEKEESNGHLIESILAKYLQQKLLFRQNRSNTQVLSLSSISWIKYIMGCFITFISNLF